MKERKQNLSIIVSLFAYCFLCFLFIPVSYAASEFIAEDLTTEFSGELLDVQIIPDGNGMIELSTVDQYNTYVVGGPQRAEGVATTVDVEGNMYSTGYFYSTVDFNATDVVDQHTSIGGSDIFLTKINADGTHGYAYTMGGASDDQGLDIATDEFGNLYMTGFFQNTADLDPTDGTDMHTSSGGTDIFITRINADGSYGYTHTMGSTQDDRGQSISAGVFDHFGFPSDSIYFTGFFEETVDFDPTAGTDNHTSGGGTDVFMTKIRTDGNYEHTYTFGDSNDDFGNGIAMSQFNEVYLTGSFDGVIDFNPDPSQEDLHSSNGTVATFLTKFYDGTFYDYTQTYDQSEGYDVTVGMLGEVYVTGHAWSDTNSSEDIFLAKKSIDGTSDFAYLFGGPGDDRGYALVSDFSGAIYTVGKFEDTADLDPTSTAEEFTSNGHADVFITKINHDDSYEYTRTLGGQNEDSAFDIASSLFTDNLFVIGSFRKTVDFDVMGGVDMYTSQGQTDVFLTRFTSEGTSSAPSPLFHVSGMYQVQVIPQSPLKSWTKFTFTQNAPEGTTLMHEILDQSCSFPIVPPTMDTTIDMTNMRIRDPELCLRTTFLTDDQTISPRLDGWEATYKGENVK